MTTAFQAPAALQAAVDALGQHRGQRLGLVPAARPDWWSVLAYTPDGTAHLLVPAMEAAALYRHLHTLTTPAAVPP